MFSLNFSLAKHLVLAIMGMLLKGGNALVKDNTCQDIAAVCNILAPLLTTNPKDPSLHALVSSVVQFDPKADSQSWPFGDVEQVEKGITLMTGAVGLNSSGNISPDNIQKLSHAYQRLFIGPNFKAAPPWGSVYTDRDQVIFGKSCIELNIWMRRSGISSNTDSKEPQDHIGLMMSLLGWIAQNKPQLIKEYLSQHLLTWSHHYFEQFVAAAAKEHTFYEGLGILADATLEGMRTCLDLDVKYPRFYR